MADLGAFIIPLGTDIASWSSAHFKLGCYSGTSQLFDSGSFAGVGGDVVMGAAVAGRVITALMTLMVPNGLKNPASAGPVLMSVAIGIFMNVAGILCALKSGDRSSKEKKHSVRTTDTYLKLYVGNLLLHIVAMYLLMNNFTSHGFALSEIGAMQGTLMFSLIGLAVANFALINSKVKYNSEKDNKVINGVAMMMVTLLIVLTIHTANQK